MVTHLTSPQVKDLQGLLTPEPTASRGAAGDRSYGSAQVNAARAVHDFSGVKLLLQIYLG